MTKSFALLVSSLSLIASGCAGMKVADFEANVTLPASQDCYGIKVVSKKEVRRPKAQCNELKKRAVFIDSKNYKLLKNTILTNCQVHQCKEITGAFDGLFFTIDEALKQIPVR